LDFEDDADPVGRGADGTLTMRLFFLPQAEASNKHAAIITAVALVHSHVRDMRTSSSSITMVGVRKYGIYASRPVLG
jgi:hypothetical protein